MSTATSESQHHESLLREFEARKQTANTLYRKRDFSGAKEHYLRMLHEIVDREQQTKSSTRYNEEDIALKEAILYLNIAACNVALKEYTDAIDHCKKVLHIEPSNPKALYRLGKSHYMLGEYDTADLNLRESLTHTQGCSTAGRCVDNDDGNDTQQHQPQTKEISGPSDAMVKDIKRMLDAIENVRRKQQQEQEQEQLANNNMSSSTTTANKTTTTTTSTSSVQFAVMLALMFSFAVALALALIQWIEQQSALSTQQPGGTRSQEL